MNKLLLCMLGASLVIPYHARGINHRTYPAEQQRFYFLPHIIKGAFNGGLSLWLTFRLRDKYHEFNQGKLSDKEVYFYSLLGIPAWIITTYLSVHHSALVTANIEQRLREKPVREVVKDLGKDIAKETIKDTAKDIKNTVTSPFTSNNNDDVC